MREGRRLLQRLQQRVLALLGHRVGSLDHEHAAARSRTAGRRPADHPLAHVLDEVLGAARAQPHEVGVRRRIGERPAARVVGVGDAVGEQLGRECPRRGGLAGAGRPDEQVGVKWRARRPRRARRRAAGCRRGRLHDGAEALIAAPRRCARIRAWTAARVAGRVDDDDPLRVTLGELVVGGRDPPLKFHALGLEAVFPVALAGGEASLAAFGALLGPRAGGSSGPAGSRRSRAS